jgi:hypothetical protein
MTTASFRRRGLVAAGVVATVVAAGAPALALDTVPPESDDDDFNITVVDEGAPTGRVLIRPAVTAGAAAESTTSLDIDTSMHGSGFPLDIDFVAASYMTRTTEVLSVDPDGSRVTRETITDFVYALTTGDGTPTDLDELGLEGDSATDFSQLVDVPLIAEYGPSGDLDSLDVESAAKATATAEQDALIDELAESGVGLESFATMFPDTPIGQGAVWTISEADNPVGASFPVQLRLTLVSLVGDDYTVELATEGDPLELFETDEDPGTEVTGDLTLTGTLGGSVSNGLDLRVSMELAMDVTVTEDDLEVDVEAEFAAEHVSTPH